MFSVCPDIQSIGIVLTGTAGGAGGSVCGQTLVASSCDLSDASGGLGGASSVVEFVISKLSPADELHLVACISGENSDDLISCTPGLSGWTDWDCGPASAGANG